MARIAHGIKIDPEVVHDLCRRHRIAELLVFGAFLRGDFGPDSDVDFVVRMEGGFRLTFRELGEVERELSQIVGRPVDVVLGAELDAPGANPYRKRHILQTMERVYARR